jgi:hypothetical protein
MTVENWWSKSIAATGDSIIHKEEFLHFIEDVHEASNTLDDRQQVNDLRTWVHENDETPIAVCKGDGGIVAEVLNRRRAEYLSEE